jgi:hypothetical protein
MTFTGTLADINAALAGMAFNPAANYSGAATLNVQTSDLGQTGAGGALTDSKSVAINVVAVNDPPVNTVPGTQTSARIRRWSSPSPTATGCSSATSTPATDRCASR